jgi:hypothetical protein
MKVFDIFSKRQRRLRDEMPDVYVYDDIPEPLRVQVVHIWIDAIGKPGPSSRRHSVYSVIHQQLCREYGVFSLASDVSQADPLRLLSHYLLTCKDLERVLDLIELSFVVIDTVIRSDSDLQRDATISPDHAIRELNHRFREHGVGYQYESGQIVRVDSKLLHAEAVKPALQLLQGQEYQGSNEEFLAAHEHYRHARHEECLVECLKAFESTLKTICTKRGWDFDPTDSVNNLIRICFDQGLVPGFLQSQFAALRSVLESGVPTARNRMAGHGRGVEAREVPEYFASYVLHMTAVTILFLVRAEREL